MRKSLLVSLLLLAGSLCANVSWAQDRQLTGKVTAAEDNAPLPGVSVVLKGSTKGTTTDANGAYALSVPNTGAVLIFSSVGVITKDVKLGNRTTLDVSLSGDSRLLNEVVVTGSGVETSKANLGIAVESVSAKNLPQTPSASIDQALVGKIPGAQISSTSGNPGDPVNIVLRGINSVQNGTKPMILVDGLQVAATDINSLDLSNVDRIEVAQGAASASIYGAQGANGVIQVFTKKGKKSKDGRIAVNFSTSYSSNEFLNVGGLAKADKHPYLTDGSNNLVDAKGAILKYNDIGGLPGISYKYGGAARYAIQDIRNTADQPYNANIKYYDHFKQVFQTGTSMNNTINLSGATDKSDFNLAIANNHTVSPILKNGFVDRTNVTLNVGTEVFKGFTVRAITQLIYTKNTIKPGLGGPGGFGYGVGDVRGVANSNFGGSPYGFLNTSPFFDLTATLADGSYIKTQRGGSFLSVNGDNPFYQNQYSDQLDNKIDLVASLNANYKINKFVELDAKYGMNYRNEQSRWTFFNQSLNDNSNYYGNYSGSFAPDNTGEIIDYRYSTTFQNFLATAFIRTDFQNDFHINLPIQTSTQVSFDYRKKKYTEYDTYGVGLSLAPPINVSSTKTQAVAFDYTEPFVTYGYLVNQQVNFGQYGGVTAGVRSDFSSAFGQGSTPFTFPHFDGRIAPLAFFKNSVLNNYIPYFKIRAAYGEAGIQPGAFDRYPVLGQQNLGAGLVYSIPGSSKNANLNVEVSKEKEIGVDFSLNTNQGRPWFRAVNGAFSYWARSSANVIYTVSVPPSQGSTGQLTNAIDMSSNGVQFQLNVPVYTSSGFKWDFTTNFGHQTSKIDAIAGGADIILTTSAGSTALVLTPGQVIGQIFGYKALTSLDFKRQDGTRYINPADESKYEIVNGKVTNKANYQMQFTDEKYALADPNPKFNMSFINGFTFRDFVTLNFQFDWVYGSHLYNQTKEWTYRDGIHSDFTKPVTINGNTGAYTAYWSSAYYNLWGSTRGAGNNATKDYFLEDASFVRLRNVSLAFDLAKLVKIPYINRAQLVLTGRNLMTWTKYTGQDPEVSSGTANSSFDRGIDHSQLPNTKSYQVGLNFGF